MGVKEDYVFSQMESGDICVFPSEVSARGWLISYARKRGAVFAGCSSKSGGGPRRAA